MINMQRFRFIFSLLLTGIFLFQSCKKSDESPTTAPTGLATSAATQIEAGSATVGGQVSATGGSTITSFGICYSLTKLSPTTADQVAYGSGNPLNPFTLTLSGLEQTSKYYYSAFATNEKGTSYGPVMQFTTLTLPLPTLLTATPEDMFIFDTTALVSGNITDDAGLTITEQGICWKIASGTDKPTTANSKKAMGSGGGTFSGTISGLLPVFTYKMRAYAITANGTAYGNTVEFETKPGVPRVVTNSVTGVKSDSATVDITVASANGAFTRRFGILVSLTANPTDTSDSPFTAKGDAGGGAGGTSYRFGNLTPNTTYHARGFCSNSAGIGYGNSITFTTLP